MSAIGTKQLNTYKILRILISPFFVSYFKRLKNFLVNGEDKHYFVNICLCRLYSIPLKMSSVLRVFFFFCLYSLNAYPPFGKCKVHCASAFLFERPDTRSPCPTAILYQELFLAAMRFFLVSQVNREVWLCFICCALRLSWGLLGCSWVVLHKFWHFTGLLPFIWKFHCL